MSDCEKNKSECPACGGCPDSVESDCAGCCPHSAESGCAGCCSHSAGKEFEWDYDDTVLVFSSDMLNEKIKK